ncbi:MAG: DUF1732 domain-containing protein [Candidatus Dependentiae bacterium]|nr:DUF1732 domain-containing protein [Candidatus Dependentiae bacterium]
MTGFSTRTISLVVNNNPITITLTLRAVNGRYFEMICKLPHALAHLETECQKIFKERLVRGTIYFTAYTGQPGALKSPTKPAFTMIKSYLDAFKEIQNKFGLAGTITINDIVTLPNIFETTEEALEETTAKAFLAELQPLIDQLEKERFREGVALAQDLQQRIANLKEYMNQIVPRAQEIMAQKKEQLLTTLTPFLQTSDESRETSKEQQLQVIYNQLEKMDIHEEIVRFNAHIENFLAIIRAPEKEKGKRLDFTLQELFREINTIAAKCSDAQISSATIAMKVEVEKAREQVQNIL